MNNPYGAHLAPNPGFQGECLEDVALKIAPFVEKCRAKMKFSPGLAIYTDQSGS